MTNAKIAAKPRNVFDQFEGRENRLTHALVVALDKDRAFLKAFLSKFAPGALSNPKQLSIAEQRLPGVAFGEKGLPGERGLPDALILAPDGKAIALEIKLTASVRLPQLRAHTATLERRLTVHDSEVAFRCVKALLITGVETAGLPAPWTHVEWSQIYDLLTKQSGPRSAWSNELVEYLELMERRMTDDEVGDGVRLTRFNGIPFAKGEEFIYLSAKRVLRLLVSELKA
ncbi:hypothetical protein K2X33_07625, partial [bacterium]|nr:hypothetical protein [bacterium]